MVAPYQEQRRRGQKEACYGHPNLIRYGYIIRDICILVTIIFIFSLLPACSSEPYIVNHTEGTAHAGKQEIYIVSHGWHTGFVVPALEIQSRLPKLKERFGSTAYLEFGWGDKGFYQANEITTGLTLRAIFWPTGAVIHTVAVPKNIEEYFSNSKIEKLCLNDAAYSSLLSFISSSFYKNQAGEILELKKGNYGNSQFYKGVGEFYLMNTCNKWTAKGFKSAGLDISPTFKLTAGSIISYLQARNLSLKNASSTQNATVLHTKIHCRLKEDIVDY